MTKTKIVDYTSKPEDGHAWFSTTTQNTGLSQRATLEEIIVNLATALGQKEVKRKLSARGAYFYSDGVVYQSATNTILDLSRKVLKTLNKDA